MKKWILSALLLSGVLVSCHVDEPVPENEVPGKRKGVFIANEGNFMYGNASLSFYEPASKKVFNQLYYTRNNVPLGDVAQFLAMRGDQIFIVVNNSGKIVVADQYTLEHKGVIKGLSSPRAIHFVNDKKAYVSDMKSGVITVINPGTLQVISTISTNGGKGNAPGKATENFVQVGTQVFVSCWVSGNQLLVIDSARDVVTDSIDVPFQPNKMVVDRNGKIWLQTDGEYSVSNPDPEKPALVKIDPATKKVEKIWHLEASGAFITDIRLNPSRDSIYFLAGGLYKMSVTSNQLPHEVFLPAEGRYYYSLGVDPVSGEIYLADPLDYSQNGVIYRYSPSGILLDSFTVGICPGEYLFRN